MPPIDNPEAVPVILVPTKALGVPKFGVVRVGEVANTILPEPVTLAAKAVATPVPSPVIEPTAGVIVVLPAKVN